MKFLQFLALTVFLIPGVVRGADTYSKDTTLKEASEFFGKGAQDLAKAVEKAFKEKGEPTGFIKGQEGGGALIVGVRYGDGELVLKNGKKTKVHWTGPSIGLDVGGNASKVFVLVYGLEDPEKIWRRFPAVDGSLYLIGGFSMNYQNAEGITLAPIRLGAGLRAGANVGYMHYSKEKTWSPF
jgi:hypothetical protein